MSQIVDLQVFSFEYAIPAEGAYGTSRGLNFKRSTSIVELTTDEGTVGRGEASGPVRPIQDYLALIRGFFVGKRLYDVELISSMVRDRLDHFGEGHHLSCLSGVNVAAFDALGKELGRPICDLIGGRSAPAIPCYATTGYMTRDGLAGLENQLSNLDATYFSGVKIKIGASPRSDVERVRLARRILGDDILLMVDINGNYTPDIALQSIRAIEPYDIHWCEEPLPTSNIRGHAELRARSPIPIATGEGLHTVHQFKALIDAGGVDILQPAVGKCGGLSGLKSVATLAEAEHLRIVPAVWGGALLVAATLHFIASLSSSPHTDNAPFPRMLEFDVSDNPLRDRLTRESFSPGADGLPLPPGPGLGLELDFESVERYRLRT